ncbi:hypothetical protein OG897_20880 [Streptomyces sp. NBC_00237]|uniref:hypothetical protein n=1 Tax=Streptomyces sp. NBC_00237 TaxID=2975687 RepID=UPI0022554C62|nr:hypothetical protein [Streptomyces sp. NBC_00237]MCX5203899.1 hypothetical protein [Streptomyces sp. NBC_00237]
MRDSIARLITWVLSVLAPSTRTPGKHSAAYLTDRPAAEPETVSPWARPWTGPSAETVRGIFHAEETDGLNPDQRERWRAVAFSELGLDYDFPTVNIHAVRRTVAA